MACFAPAGEFCLLLWDLRRVGTVERGRPGQSEAGFPEVRATGGCPSLQARHLCPAEAEELPGPRNAQRRSKRRSRF